MKTKALIIISIVFFFSPILWSGHVERAFAQSVIADSIIQTSPCAGSNIYIPYTVNGGNFHYGNVFTAQLSNSSGSFSNPTNIGSTPYWGNGLIIGTIPVTATLGINYKVRIIASSPHDTSAVCPNNVIVIHIAQIATVTVTPLSGNICSGDSALLSDITPAQNYLWSNGASTQSIEVNQSGSYTVTVTDVLGCKTTSTPITVTVQECLSVQNVLSSDVMNIYPNPFGERATIELKDMAIGMKDLRILIYDLIGKEVYKSEIKARTTEIERGNLSPGIFFYKIAGQEEVLQTGKIIVQ